MNCQKQISYKQNTLKALLFRMFVLEIDTLMTLCNLISLNLFNNFISDNARVITDLNFNEIKPKAEFLTLKLFTYLPKLGFI